MAIKMIYLSNLLTNIGLLHKDYKEVFKDKTTWLSHVLGGRERAKHIDIRKHFAHEAVQNSHIWLYQISTEHQLADLLTKQLQLGPLERCLHRFLGEDQPRFNDCNFLED